MLLETEMPGCRLRPWRIEDKAELVRNANNRRIWRNLPDQFPHPYTEAIADFWVQFANQPSSSVHFAIELEEKSVGAIGITAGSGHSIHTGQFGYWIGESYWGRGVATAAARAMVGHARSSLPFVRLESPVHAWNPASMRVLEKAGFTREGVLKSSTFKDGELIDCMMYALIFEAKKPKIQGTKI